LNVYFICQCYLWMSTSHHKRSRDVIITIIVEYV